MDRAYDVLMCVEILAEQLLLLEVVDKMNYQCPACSIPVNPVAFESGCKVRPYFKILPNVPHKNDCFIHGMSALVSVGLKKSIKKDMTIR